MRRFAPVLVLPALIALAAAPLAAAEATRTIKVELTSPASGPFAVENLAGHMRVVPGSGAAVVAVATVHAESDAIASGFRFEQVSGRAGRPTLRVIYPLNSVKTVRYDPAGAGKHSSGWFGGNSTTVDYDGVKVKVSSGSGTLMYADVEVRVPAVEIDANFRNAVGKLDAEELKGSLTFDTGQGDQSLQSLQGKTVAGSGSGDITAADVGGSFKCDTGSGDCTVRNFDGEKLDCDTGSGDVSIDSARSRLVNADTGSGSIRALEVDAEEFTADTGSGDIDLSTRGARLVRVKADTGSGDVTLRLGADASFEARADQGSGDIVNRYPDAQPIVKGKEVLGYRRGDGKTRITVDTGSGDLVLEPGQA